MEKVKKVRYQLLKIVVDSHLNSYSNKLITHHFFERLGEYSSLSSLVNGLRLGIYSDGFYRVQKRVNGKLMFTFNVEKSNECVFF